MLIVSLLVKGIKLVIFPLFPSFLTTEPILYILINLLLTHVE